MLTVVCLCLFQGVTGPRGSPGLDGPQGQKVILFQSVESRSVHNLVTNSGFIIFRKVKLWHFLSAALFMVPHGSINLYMVTLGRSDLQLWLISGRNCLCDLTCDYYFYYFRPDLSYPHRLRETNEFWIILWSLHFKQKCITCHKITALKVHTFLGAGLVYLTIHLKMLWYYWY